MNGRDQVFIDAYGSSPERVSSARGTGTCQAHACGFSDAPPGVRFRLDPPVPRSTAVPAPHGWCSATSPSGAVPAYPIEITTWDAAGPVPFQATVMAASLFPGPRETAAQRAAASNQPAAAAKPPQAETRSREETERPTQACRVAYPAEPAAASAKPEARREPEKFRPVWEVDRFSWPAEMLRLYEAESAYFQHAGEKLFEASKEGLRVLGVASTRADEGCTTLALCLARAASAAGLKVAVMDANQDSPQLAERLGVAFPHGWQEAVRGETPLSETAIASVSDALTLLPLAGSSHRKVPLQDPKVTELVQAVAAAADLLVVDMGTASAGRGFEQGARCPLNAAIVVRDVRRTSEQDALATAVRLKEGGIAAVGIAENYAPSPKGLNKAAA